MSRIFFILNVFFFIFSNLYVYVIIVLVYSMCCFLCFCVLFFFLWIFKVVSLLFSIKRDIDFRLMDL